MARPNTHIKIRIEEDRMGNYVAQPVNARVRAKLQEAYGESDAFAQADSQLWYEVDSMLAQSAKANMKGGYTATALVDAELYENWVAYHNEPLTR